MTDRAADRRAIETSLAIAADDVGKIAAKIASLYVKASQIVGEMKPLGDRALVESLLVSRGGMSASDAETLYGLHGILEGRDETLQKTTPSVGAMKALVDAPDDVREQAFRLLALGQKVEADDVAKIAEHDDRAATSEWDRQERDRQIYLESLISAQASPSIRRIEAKADELVELIDEFIIAYAPRDPEDDDKMLLTKPRYHDAHVQISRMAAKLLSDVNRLFGRAESFDQTHVAHGECFTEARQALERFASGRFAHNGGFALAATEAAALNYLVSNERARLASAASEPAPAAKLRVLELCAGAGGMAIGLMAAGFEHAALYEKSGIRVDTLKRNWPNWRVFKEDVARIPDEVYQSYEGIDLVAGGPPCKPFSQTGKKEGSASNENLFPEMVRAVRLTKPKAFVFENVLGLDHKPNGPFLASILRQFEELEYSTDIHVLDGAQFGLPQSRNRLFIVGLHADIPSLFRKPSPTPPFERCVAEVLGPAVIRHETPEHLKKNIKQDTPQWMYDRWAENWRKKHADRHIPTVTALKEESRPERKAPWLEAGFDISKVVAEPPTVEEVESIDWKPKISVEALALSQGFPAGWTFFARKTGQIAMIGDALPPVMAQAVGLAVRSALTGETFDLRNVVEEPVIDETRIGKGWRPLRRPPAGYLKASRVADGESVETVEPNRKRRKAVVALAEMVTASRRAEADGEPGFVPSNLTAPAHRRARKRFLSS